MSSAAGPLSADALRAVYGGGNGGSPVGHGYAVPTPGSRERRPVPIPAPLPGVGERSAAAAVGRSKIASRASSRPASCDPQTPPVQASPIRRSSSGASGQSGASHELRRERRPRRERDDSVPRVVSSPLDSHCIEADSPDSLTELLGLHSRPSSYGANSRASGGNNGGGVYAYQPPSPLAAGGRWQQMPGSGAAPVAAMGPVGRPTSRDLAEQLAGGGGARPPRVPGVGSPPLASGVAGLLGGGLGGGANIAGGVEQRSRPSSRTQAAAPGVGGQGTPGTNVGCRHPAVASSAVPSGGFNVAGVANAAKEFAVVDAEASLSGRPTTPRPPRAPQGGGGGAVGGNVGVVVGGVGGGAGNASAGRPPGGAGGSEFQTPQQFQAPHGPGVRQASPFSSPSRVPVAGACERTVYPAEGCAFGSPTIPRAVSSSAPPWGVHDATKTVALVSLASDPNEDFRSYMEDGHKIVDPLLQKGSRDREDRWALFAVYDGHGGRNEVDYCESKLHEVVLAELRSLAPGKDVRSVLTSSFAKIDGQLAMLGAWDSGCTATVVLAHRQAAGLTLHVANVGDSRAVLLGESCTRRVSVDHRASDASEAQRVVREGGIVRHGRVGGQLSVSRSLGDHRLKSLGVSCVPDVCTCETTGNFALVIASDGLWDTLEDDDARKVIDGCVDRAVAQGGDDKAVSDRIRDSAAQDLVECAKERGSRDNILAMVVFF